MKLSTDLISEILLRLPERSVVRFRCVSKFWLSITTDSYFIKLFETRNPRPTSLLICYKEDDELVVSSIPQHTLDQKSVNSYSYSQPSHTYRMKFPEDCWFFTNSVHGLICFQTLKDVIVWNPSTSKFLTLPKPSKSNVTTYLGYDPVEAKHKVIAMMRSLRTCTVCMVITLGSSQESWRIVKTNQNHTPCQSNGFGQCIKGVIYYLASTYQTNRHIWVIIRFDVRSEKFDTIQLPSDIQVDRLISYKERLACVYRKEGTKESGFTLLILDEENKWSSKDFLAPFYYRNQHMQIDFQLRGFTHASEFMYEPNSLYEYRDSLNVFFFDPVRNNFRRVGFKGIAEDEESRGWFHIFPYHIESRMSL